MNFLPPPLLPLQLHGLYAPLAKEIQESSQKALFASPIW